MDVSVELCKRKGCNTHNLRSFESSYRTMVLTIGSLLYDSAALVPQMHQNAMLSGHRMLFLYSFEPFDSTFFTNRF